jgi:hypothetical protein
MFYSECKEEGNASGRDGGKERGVKEIFSKSMDESSSSL